MVGPKSDTENRMDKNGKVLDFSPIKVYGSWNGCNCKHVVSDFPKIKEIIEIIRPETIVELGTGGGGVTAFFSEIVKQWNGMVYTFDYVFGCKALVQQCDNVKFQKCDVACTLWTVKNRQTPQLIPSITP